MSPTNVTVNLGDRSYDIVVTSDDLAGIGPFARQRCQSDASMIILDETVSVHAEVVRDALAAAGFQTHWTAMPPGEATKSLSAASHLYDVFAKEQVDRQTLVVAVGGGVIGDLAGFVAATYARGLPLLMAPTTLLAMVDSSVGGKVGINHPKAKNLIGAFHQPIGVWIDTATLRTLPDREYGSGLAEVVKYGVTLDAELFEYLEKHANKILARAPEVVRQVVARCCRLKADIVEQDERETTGRRMVLNYGHTFAHAFETVAGYGTWLHGEAVAAGMICASRLAEQRGLIEAELTARQQQLLERFGLPTRPERWPTSELLAVMQNDKKAVAGKLRFVLPRRLGDVGIFDNIPEAEVERTLKEITA